MTETSLGVPSMSPAKPVLSMSCNASNNDLVRTKTLTKNCIVQIDGTPFKTWYKEHYGMKLGEKGTPMGVESEDKVSSAVRKKWKLRRDDAKLGAKLAEQFVSGKIYACISSRPGQSGRADGYILEAEELDFYLKNMKK